MVCLQKTASSKHNHLSMFSITYGWNLELNVFKLKTTTQKKSCFHLWYQVGSLQVSGNHCICLRVISVETHITKQTHLVAENRIRCVLQDFPSGDKVYCWFFGEYSDGLGKFQMKIMAFFKLFKLCVVCPFAIVLNFFNFSQRKMGKLLH